MSEGNHAVTLIRDFWINHLWVDVALAAAILAAHGAAVLFWPATDLFGRALPVDRRGVYTAAAIVVSLIGSFSGVAIGQLGSAKGARTNALKKQAGEMLARNWQAIFVTAMFSALVAIAALLLDPSVARPGASYVVIRWIFEFAVLLSVARFLRLSALFREVMSLASREAGEVDETRVAPPTAHPGWNNKQAS